MFFSKKDNSASQLMLRAAAFSASALVAAGFLLGMSDVRVVAKSNAEIQSEINTLNGKMSQITKEQKDLKNQIAGAKSQAADYSTQITNLSYEIDLIDEQIIVIESMLKQYDELTAAQEVQIAELEVEIEKQQHILDDMIRMSYEYGGAASSVEFIFSAENFTDLLSRIDLLSYHLSYNDKVLENYNETLESLEKTKAEYEQAKVTMQQYKSEIWRKSRQRLPPCASRCLPTPKPTKPSLPKSRPISTNSTTRSSALPPCSPRRIPQPTPERSNSRFRPMFTVSLRITAHVKTPLPARPRLIPAMTSPAPKALKSMPLTTAR